MRSLWAAVPLVLLALAGCSGDGDEPATTESKAAAPATTRAEAPPTTRAEPAPARSARCPASLSNCRTASGRIAFVEAVDPDGDGDAHFVLVSSESITAPGVSIIDVKRSLRPHPLPGRGDRISAAGPVYRGSFGQRQIEAVELVVQR